MNLFKIFSKKDDQNVIKITQKDIDRQAEIMFYDMIKIRNNIEVIFNRILGKKSLTFFRQYIDSGSIIPKQISMMNKYNKALLESDDYATVCLLKMCVEKVLNKKVSFTEYQSYFQILSHVSSIKYDKKDLSTASMVLKNFMIDKDVLPVKFRQHIFAFDEFIVATKMITTFISKTKSISDGFKSYDDYFFYMNGEIKKLIIELQSNNFFSYQDEERFTILAVSQKNGLPINDVFYKNIDAQQDALSSLKNSSLKKLQEKLVNRIFFGIGGEIGEINLDDSDD
jgi:hypothetical protein